MTPAPHSILFDVGANNGAWAASYLRQHARARAYLFEPNRRFDAELALLAGKYGAVHVRAAAWIEGGNRTFTYSRNDESSSLVPGQAERWAKNSNLGLRFPCKPPREFAAVTRSLPRGRWDGTVTRRTGTLGTAICDHQRKELVPTVDLAAFVSRVALEAPSARLVMHLDIEGAEYDVLEHLMRAGVACSFKRGALSVEWHQQEVPASAARLEPSSTRIRMQRAARRENLLRKLRACGVQVKREVR